MAMTVFFEDHTPPYWRRDHGKHFEVKAACGASCSAVRANGQEEWCVFDCLGERSSQGADTFEEKMSSILLDLLIGGLTKALRDAQEQKALTYEDTCPPSEDYRDHEQQRMGGMF